MKQTLMKLEYSGTSAVPMEMLTEELLHSWIVKSILWTLENDNNAQEFYLQAREAGEVNVRVTIWPHFEESHETDTD